MHTKPVFGMQPSCDSELAHTPQFLEMVVEAKTLGPAHGIELYWSKQGLCKNPLFVPVKFHE